jgi:imidazolonepropionase-like amidohydrolase
MPGMIDTHVHLQLRPGPDHAWGRAIYRSDLESGLLAHVAMRQARLALRSGITTVRDLASDMSILAVRSALAEGEPGPRLLVAGCPITTTGGHCHWISDLHADDEGEVRHAVRWLVEQGVDCIKVMASGGNMTPGSNALAPQYSSSELRCAVNEAHRLGRRVVAHALNVDAIKNCVESGVDSVDHCTWQLPDGSLRYDEELGKQIVEGGTRVGITGSGILRVLLERGAEGQGELRKALDAHRQLYAAGGRVGVHSDAGVRFTPIERFDLSLKVMEVGLSISPREVLVAATNTAAEALGLEQVVGAIEVGKRGDLAVLESDPCADLANVRSVRAVFRDGRKVVEHGRMVVPDREGAGPWNCVRRD